VGDLERVIIVTVIFLIGFAIYIMADMYANAAAARKSGQNKTGRGVNRNGRPPQTWDYSYKSTEQDHWFIPNPSNKTHAYVFGWGNTVDGDDYLLFNVNGQTARWKINDIEWYEKPFRFWAAVIEHAPRNGEKKSGGKGSGGGGGRREDFDD
jgi:hypothetical protein